VDFVGQRIAEIRKKKGLLLKELAGKTGLSSSYLSLLERGKIVPSLKALEKIAQALDVPSFFFLMNDVDRVTENNIVKKDERAVFRLPNACYSLEILTPIFNKGIKRQFDVFYVVLKPKSYLNQVFMVHEADECSIVLSGKVDVLIREERFVLCEGDSIYISSFAPHNYYNGEDQDVSLLCIMAPAVMKNYLKEG